MKKHILIIFLALGSFLILFANEPVFSLASQEQHKAEKESFQVSDEMFTQGMINSVDFFLSKNNLIIAENQFTQAKYNLILKKQDHRILSANFNNIKTGRQT